MELKGRLKLIASKVPACDAACDIGTDHGYIPIYLVQNHICKRVIAADIKEGPLTAATDNIRQCNLENSIETRLGDGLQPIGCGEVDVIVIAGMGGILIKDILEKDFDKAKAAKALILQPMNAIEILREWLYKKGFDIYDEELTSEGEKVYNVLAAKWTGERASYDEVFLYIGKKLIEKKDPLLHRYLNKRLAQVEEILEGLSRSTESNEDILKYEYLKENYSKLLKDL